MERSGGTVQLVIEPPVNYRAVGGGRRGRQRSRGCRWRAGYSGRPGRPGRPRRRGYCRCSRYRLAGQAAQQVGRRLQLSCGHRDAPVIARHRGNILGPHALVSASISAIAGSVLPQQIRADERDQLGPIRRDGHWVHRRGARGLVGARDYPGLSAACSEWVAAAPSHAAYGAAAAIIASDDGPCHDWPAKREVTDPNELAADHNSAASPSRPSQPSAWALTQHRRACVRN